MNSDFHVLNLAAYSTPEIFEDPHQDYVAFGKNNDFYSEIIEAFLNSPTTSSVVQGVSNQIFGKGFDALDSSRKPDEYASFKSLFKARDLKRVCLDYKLLGEAAFQVTYKGQKVVQVTHFNRETLRAEKCDDKGKINAYYYSPKWSEHRDGDKLTRIPVFGSGATNEIYIIRKYIPSMHYYSPPSSISSLNYSSCEALISEFLVNEVTNNFSSGKIISFSNGVPTVEKQQMIKSEILNKLTGVNGEKVIVSFSDGPENKTTIEDITAVDSADVYQYIADQCTAKILLAHRITSPLLVGIRDTGNGLGSNSEEIQNAHNLFENVVIRPYQDDIIEAVEDILAVNGISLKIYVKTLTPIEFTDEVLVTQEQKEEETGQKLSLATQIDGRDAFETKDQAIQAAEKLNCSGYHEHIVNEKVYYMPCESHEIKYKNDKPEMSADHEKAILEKIKDYGEVLGEEWELIEDEEAGSLEEERQAQKNVTVLDKQATKLFSFDPETTAKSEFDQGLYILRYKYDGDPDPQRQFCKDMMALNSGQYGMLYRFEDIENLSALDPNPGLGLGGTPNYDLFLFAGGNNCRHRWRRMVFFRKREDGKFLPKSTTDIFENDKKVANTPFQQPENSGQAQKTPASRGIGNKK